MRLVAQLIRHMAAMIATDNFSLSMSPPLFKLLYRALHASRKACYIICMYRKLDEGRIIDTAEALGQRIDERFDGSGLSKVSLELTSLCKRAARTAARQKEPIWPLRIATGAAIAALCGLLLYAILRVPMSGGEMEVDRFAQGTEASLNILIILGSAIVFLATIEVRAKRRRALKGLHELRCLAHVIDMHQLTKDPHKYLADRTDTKSSPEARMSPYDLARYLDYCAEMLSILGKLAALYAQGSDDHEVLNSVDSIEELTVALSQKIWQKLRMLQSM